MNGKASPDGRGGGEADGESPLTRWRGSSPERESLRKVVDTQKFLKELEETFFKKFPQKINHT